MALLVCRGASEVVELNALVVFSVGTPLVMVRYVDIKFFLATY